jgi:hypothetical protein
MNERESYKLEKFGLSGRYDNWTLALSSCAIASSIIFIDKSFKPFILNSIFLFYFSLLFFVFCLVVTLFSLLSSQKAIHDMIISLDYGNKPKLFWSKTTGICNWISLVTFCLGVVFILLFLGVNLPNHA